MFLVIPKMTLKASTTFDEVSKVIWEWTNFFPLYAALFPALKNPGANF